MADSTAYISTEPYTTWLPLELNTTQVTRVHTGRLAELIARADRLLKICSPFGRDNKLIVLSNKTGYYYSTDE